MQSYTASITTALPKHWVHHDTEPRPKLVMNERMNVMMKTNRTFRRLHLSKLSKLHSYKKQQQPITQLQDYMDERSSIPNMHTVKLRQDVLGFFGRGNVWRQQERANVQLVTDCIMNGICSSRW